MRYHPDHLRPAFAQACASYLSAPRWALESMLAEIDSLGPPVSACEHGVRHTTAWQIRNWAETRALREPLVLERRPAFM